MANYPQTGSTLLADTGKNKTSTALSTNIIITVEGGDPVGAVQTLAINEKRAVKQIDEVGTDGHIDSAPHQSTNISGTCQRVRFDAARIAEAFGRGYIHVSSQVYPFNIVIFDKSRKDSSNWISTVIRNVWITGIDVTYSATDWVIVENMTWEAEGIFSYRGTSGNNAAPPLASGIRGIPHADIAQERQADIGLEGRRGSLDSAGLIDLDTSGIY